MIVQYILCTYYLIAYTNSIQVMSPRAAPRKLKFANGKKPSCESVADIEPLEKSFNKQEKMSKDQKVKGKL